MASFLQISDNFGCIDVNNDGHGCVRNGLRDPPSPELRRACCFEKRAMQSCEARRAKQDGGEGWIRTSVRLRGQIYSLLPLTTRPPLQGAGRRAMWRRAIAVST